MPVDILVIDDEEPVRDAFLLALESMDCAIRTAATGEQGIAEASAHKPELIFLDLRMPGMGGAEVLRRLQACCADVPIYIVTAFRRDFGDELNAASRDGLGFQIVDKPLSAEQIRSIVRSLLEGPQVV